MFTAEDERFMRLASEIAEEGRGFTGTNPLVGAVIVKNGEIIGKGAHLRYGEAHAERNALANCKESAEGASMYVTLEPCCHYGKTPPCTEAIIENKISRVVIALKDPNPKVAGGGIKILEDAGISVEVGLLAEECKVQNQVFLHYIKTGTPFVTMKYAMTMDGKIATYSGLSKWITGEEARKKVHLDRFESAAIMVGIGTVLTDDPMLTARVSDGNKAGGNKSNDRDIKTPIRVIADSKLRIPLDCQIMKTAYKVPTIIACCTPCEDKISAIESLGAKVIMVKEKDGHLDLNDLMITLGKLKINSLILEGGGNLNFSALSAGIVNKVQCYIAPKLFGGKDAKTPVEGKGVTKPEEAFKLKTIGITKLGKDYLIESVVI